MRIIAVQDGLHVDLAHESGEFASILDNLERLDLLGELFEGV